MAAPFLTKSISAEPIQIDAQRINAYAGQNIGGRVDSLIWRGGLNLTGPTDFGGISGIAFIDHENLVMVSDRGQFFSARLTFDASGTPTGLQRADMTPITNSKGVRLPTSFSRDAEAIEVIYREGQAQAVRVGFENLTRVADFELVANHPSGAAREVPIPDWLSDWRTNESIEAACIAPQASPIAGSTLLMTEGNKNSDGDYNAWLLGNRDKGPLSLSANFGFQPTDCAFLPNGDLLVLERGTGLLGFSMQVRRISADKVQPNQRLEGEAILTGSGGDIDNMEGLAVRQTPGGAIRIVIASDDNFNDWERTLLLEFELPGGAQ